MFSIRHWSGTELALRLALLAACFILAIRFVSPGMLMADVPVHSDVWRYFAYGQAQAHWSDLTQPRPLMLVYLKLVSILSSPRMFVLGLLLPAVLLPFFLLRVYEGVIRTSVSLLGSAFYFFACFILGAFYELQTLDYGGAIAGIFACLYASWVLEQRDEAMTWGGWLAFAAVPFLLIVASIESKPTFGAAIAVFPLCFHARIGKRKALMLAALGGAVAVLDVVKDILLGSPFTGTGQAAEGSSYQLARSAGAMMGALGYYVKLMLPALAWPVVVLALARLAYLRQWRLALAVPVFAVLAIAPMLAIPNHRVEMYSWYGAVMLLLPVGALVGEAAGRLTLSLAVRASVFVLATLALVHISRGSPTLRGWYEFSQVANANSLRALETLPARLVPGDRLLVIGLFNAHSPFKNDAFVASRFPYQLEWTVAFPPVDAPMIAIARDTQRFKPAKDIDVRDFDRVAVFSREGRLLSLLRASEIAPGAANLAQLFCTARPAPVSDAATLACLNQIGEGAAATELAGKKNAP